MKKQITILLLILLILAGCEDSKKETSRYAYVEIPYYVEAGDYLDLLSDKNPEIVYNALCSLHELTEIVDLFLSKKEPDKSTKEYLNALAVYNKVLSLLESKDNRIVSASLRFFQLCDYKNKDLSQQILAIKNNNLNVRLEQIFTLLHVLDKTSPYESFLKDAVKSRSWLISRASYYLVNNLAVEDIRKDLIQEYNKTDKEFEKLLILLSLTRSCSDDTLKFLTNEFLSTKSSKIMMFIHDILTDKENEEYMLTWLDNNYDKLSEENIKLLSMQHQNIYSLDFLEILIKNNFVPEKKFVEVLFNAINKRKEKHSISKIEKDKLDHMIEVKEKLMRDKVTRELWASLEVKKQAEEKIYREMLSEIKVIFSKFVTETEDLLKTHKFPKDKRKRFTKMQNDIDEMTPSDLKAFLDFLEKKELY